MLFKKNKNFNLIFNKIHTKLAVVENILILIKINLILVTILQTEKIKVFNENKVYNFNKKIQYTNYYPLNVYKSIINKTTSKLYKHEKKVVYYYLNNYLYNNTENIVYWNKNSVNTKLKNKSLIVIIK